jgi:hypothetical protein
MRHIDVVQRLMCLSWRAALQGRAVIHSAAKSWISGSGPGFPGPFLLR